MNLVLGAPSTTTQQLRIVADLTVGSLQDASSACSNTLVRGEGLRVGYNSKPNYVFIEEKTSSFMSIDPGQGSVLYILELSTRSGVVFSNQQDFNYTIVDLPQGVHFVTYYAGPVVTGTVQLSIFCISRSNLINNVPYTVSFTEVPPPSLSNATFSRSGTQILLNFSIPTDQAGYYGHFDCGAILEPQYLTPFSYVNIWAGAGAYCYWTTPSRMVVQLGNNALPRIGDTIGIQGGILSGIAPFATPAAPASGAYIVGPPEQDEPILLISAPRFISGCTPNVTLDSTSSLGTTGRDWFIPITWSLLNTTLPGSAAIQAVLATKTGQTVIDLDRGLFAPGIDYTIVATAGNHFPKISSGTAEFRVLNDESLEVEILSGSSIRTTWDAELAIPVQIRNPCNISVVSYQYQWSGIDEFTAAYLAVQALPLTVKNLWIPPRSMALDGVYNFNFTYTAVLADNRTIELWDTFEIVVDPTGEIYAIVLNGDRTVDRGLDFELDPTHSVDTSDSLDPFEFKWNCVRNSGTKFGLDCFDYQSDFLSTGRIFVSANTLASGQYLFSLIAGKNNFTRYDSLSILITVVDTDVLDLGYGMPAVTIDPFDGDSNRISVHEPLRLKGVIDSPEHDFNYTWEVSPPLFNISDHSTPLPSQFGFILDPYVLIPGIHYHFTLSATNGAGTAISSADLVAHVPAAAGRCWLNALNTSANYQLNLYRIACVEWETYVGENARTFQFGYVSPLSGRDVISTPSPNLWPRADLSVPYGTQEIFALIHAAAGATIQRVSFIINITGLSVVSDPDVSIDPVLKEWMYPRAMYGAEEEAYSLALASLEWLNYQGTWFDTSTNTTQPLWDTPIAFIDTELETKYRRVYQDCSDALNILPPFSVNRYSVRLLSEVYACMTSPTSATDPLLIYSVQSFVARSALYFPYFEHDEQSVMAFLQGSWNQLMSQQYLSYSPGEHVPLAESITDVLNFLQRGIWHGMYIRTAPRIYSWKDVFMGTVYATNSELGSYQNLSMGGASVTLGSELVNLFQTTTSETYAAWGFTLLYQNTFLFEQSTQGIKSPILQLQLTQPSTSELFTLVSDLSTKSPITIYLPELTTFDPQQLAPIVPPSFYCASWDFGEHRWISTGIEYNPSYNTTDRDPRPACSSVHLSEFAAFQALNDGIDNGHVPTDPGVGWWIFAGILGAILLAICFLLAALLWRMRRRKRDDKEAFVSPEMVALNREDID